MLQLATNGYLKATKIRVIRPPPGHERSRSPTSTTPAWKPRWRRSICRRGRALAPGGQNTNPKDPVLATYGENWLKFRLRSHPDVAAIHHADLLERS